MKQKAMDTQSGLLKRATLIIYLISLLPLLTQCQKETPQIEQTPEAMVSTTQNAIMPEDGALTQITPTPVPPQIIEEEYGEWLRANPDIYFVPPVVTSSMSLEEQRKQLTEILEERNEHAQDLYERPHYFVVYEFANPLFKEAFPEAQMFAVITNADSTDDTTSLTTMVSFDGQDYRMPLDFNQLMVDAGHQLTDETRDTLAYAYIIAGMPTEMAAHPVTCMQGREVDKILGASKFVYEIDCTIMYQDIGDATAIFDPLGPYFLGAMFMWGPLQENGWRAKGVPISSYYPQNN